MNYVILKRQINPRPSNYFHLSNVYSFPTYETAMEKAISYAEKDKKWEHVVCEIQTTVSASTVKVNDHRPMITSSATSNKYTNQHEWF
jgi:hypothetical protein